MTDLRQHAVEVHEQFSDELDVGVDEVEERLETLVSDYRVPVEEARRSVVSTYLDEADMEREQLSGGDQAAEVADIDEPEEWLDLTAKVVELWEPRADSIAQVGLLGDETGTVKFTKWAKSDLPELEEGQVYRLGNLVTDEYEGRFSVKLNSTTTIEEVDEEIEVGDDATEELTAISLEEAQEMAKDALDTEVVVEKMRETVLGRYYRVTGPTLGRYVLANETEPLDGPVDAESVLIKARSL